MLIAGLNNETINNTNRRILTMDLRTSYSNLSLSPFYAGSGAVASVTEDGTLLATSVLDRINIVQLSSPRQVLHTIENDDEQEITALRITPDGQFLCFVSQAQLLRVYHLPSKKIVRSMKVSSPVYVMECDITSTLLAIGGTDGSVSIIDIENGYVTHSFKGHGGTISSVKFHGELNSNVWRLASGDTTGVVKIWDLVKRKCLHTVQEHTMAVRGLDFRVLDEDEDQMQLISGGRDNIINLYQFDSRKKCKLLKTLPIHQQVESCGFINTDGVQNCVYTAGSDAVYQIVSLDTGSVIRKTAQPIEELFIIGVLPILEGSKMFLILSDQTLFLIDVEAAIANEDQIIDIELKIAGNHGTIADMRFVGPKLDKLALATNSPTLRVIPVPVYGNEEEERDEEMEGDQKEETQLPIEVEMYEGHEDLLNSLDATEDGMWLATASKDNFVILWRYDEQTELFKQYAKFVGHAGPVTAVGLPNVMNRPWPEFLLSASNDLTIKKWAVPKPEDGKDTVHVVKASEYTRRAHEKDINALAVSPNDSVFATASYDKTCKIWSLDTGELEATLANHKRGLWDVNFCQYDKLLATCSGDKTVKIWSLDTYSVMKTLEGHTNAVQRCSFISKNKQLVSSGADGLVKLWDCSTGECIKTLDAHNNRIWALSVLKDGDIIVTADADGVFQFWKDCSKEEEERNLEKEKEKVEHEQSLQNYLSQGDWANAFLLALRLDHPMRLFNVLKQCLGNNDSSSVFNPELDSVISTLDNDQLLLIMKRCRDWNTNARTHVVAQKMIRCIFLRHKISELSEIPGMVQIIDAIVPYTQRHYTRVDDLVEQSYILDYALVDMDKLF